jgi:leader peptidase (prepilin peptidase) / N-methyltransferase
MTRPGRAAGATVSISKWMRSLAFAKAARKLATPMTLTNAAFLLMAAGALAVSLISAPGMVGVLGAGLALVMLAIAVHDGRSFVIPDELTAAAGGLALLQAAVQEPEAMLPAVVIATLRGVAVAVIFYALRFGYARLRRRQGLGLGDVKLAFVAGAWLGWLMIPIAIQLAALAALTVYLLRQLVSGRSICATTRMPFGLFFAPAIWICWVLEVRWFAAF